MKEIKTCLFDGCDRPGSRSRGLCNTHWNFEQYGVCINGCRTPASGKNGLCPNCKKRGGCAPASRLIGWQYNTDQAKWCNVCQTVQSIENFKLHGGRCDSCQKTRKQFSYKSMREIMFKWQVEHVVQTAQGLCVKCNKPYGNYHFDHIQPYSLGGLFTVENIQVFCAWCNQSKGNTEYVDYRIFKETS